MITKLKVGAAAVALVSAFGVLALASPAQATDPAPEHRSVTTTMTDRDESGNHGIWARDRLVRTVVLTGGPAYVVPDGESAESLTAKVAGQDGDLCGSVKALNLRWRYHADVRDAGSFVTIAGDALSPNSGVALVGGVRGEVAGGFTADFTAPAHWCSFDASALDGKTVAGDDAPATSAWLKTLFTAGFDGVAINDDWSWTYTTCAEKWWDAADPASHDGESDAAGDITGAPCPTPSVTATRTGSAGATAGSGGTSGGRGGSSLPVTGSRVPMLAAGAGLGLLAVGAVLLVAALRRRIRFES